MHKNGNGTHSRVGKTRPREPRTPRTELYGSPTKVIKHHVPPRHPDKVPRTIDVTELHEKAYHLLFGNAKNLEDAIHILKRDWWTAPKQWEMSLRQ